MANLNKEETIKVRLGSNAIYKIVHRCPYYSMSFLNPDWEEGSNEKKWLNAYIMAKGTSGLKKKATRGRILKLTGSWRNWDVYDLGRIFYIKSLDEISYEDVKPKAESFETELAF